MPYRDEEANRARREKNKERMAAHSRKHYEKNKERINAKKRALREANKERAGCLF